jgi:hypothetical protein
MKVVENMARRAGASSPKSDDWAAALKLLQVSVERNVSPSRATLFDESNQLPRQGMPIFQSGKNNTLPPPPPSVGGPYHGFESSSMSVQDMLFGAPLAGASQTEPLTVQQLFGGAMSNVHQMSPKTSQGNTPSPRANNMISLSSLEQSLPSAGSSDRISAPVKKTKTEDTDDGVDRRAVPLLFGQNQNQAVRRHLNCFELL